MTRRVKAKAVEVAVPRDQAEANAMIAALGAALRERGLIQSALDEMIASIKAKAEAEAEPIQARIGALQTGLQIWAEANRAALLVGGRKSVDLPAGELGWRLRPPSVRITGAEAVIAALKALDLTRFLRVKEEIDRQAMLKEPDVAGAVPGVTIGSAGEEFYVAPLGVELSGGTA